MIHLKRSGNRRSYDIDKVADAFLTLLCATLDDDINVGLVVDGSNATVVETVKDSEWVKERSSGLDAAWALRTLMETRFRP